MSEYNGWTNYETWCVNLWITNDQGSQDYWNESAESALEAVPPAVFTREENAACRLADQLKQTFEDESPLADQPGLYADLLNAALSEVNWCEIAKSLLATACDN